MDDKPPMVFEDLPIGEEYVDEYLLTPEMARDYAEDIEDLHAWHLEYSPFGGSVAKPILIVAQHARLFKTTYLTAGNVHTRHETQFLNPARIGSATSTGVRIALDIWCETQRGEPVTVGPASVVVH